MIGAIAHGCKTDQLADILSCMGQMPELMLPDLFFLQWFKRRVPSTRFTLVRRAQYPRELILGKFLLRFIS